MSLTSLVLSHFDQNACFVKLCHIGYILHQRCISFCHFSSVVRVSVKTLQKWGHWPLEREVPGSIPCVGKGISVSEHAFLGVICRHDMKAVHRPSDRDVTHRPPLPPPRAGIITPPPPPHYVQVKESYGNSKWLLVDPATLSVQCTPA